MAINNSSNFNAIVNINSIIRKYNEAKDGLKSCNDNSKINKIIKRIDFEISSLESIKGTINNLNYALEREKEIAIVKGDLYEN